MYNQSEEYILSCQSLSFRYDTNADETIFKDLALGLREGEISILMGASGCGKSTLAYCLAGLYPEYGGERKGSIFFKGQLMEHLTPNVLAKKISILFQNPDEQFCMDKVGNEVLFALENIGYPPEHMRERMRQALEIVGISHLETAGISDLSGGTKQKVALAAVLSMNPKVLILDEPFANIDRKACLEIVQSLERFIKKQGLTVLIIDHKLDYWKDIAQRIILMNTKGEIVKESIQISELGTYKKLFKQMGLYFPEETIKENLKLPVLHFCSAVSIEGLTVSYQKNKVIDSLGAHIPKGAITSVMGENGSGKTTLLWAVAGLIKSKGNIRFGEDKGKSKTKSKTKRLTNVGVVFQNPSYQFVTLKVMDEIIYTLKAVNPQGDIKELSDAAKSYLDEFRLLPFAENSPYTLSQGQQRRLAVLSMLCGDQDILLLDEPTYAQDEQATHFIMKLLLKRVGDGMTVVMATHDLDIAMAYSQHLIVMNKGIITYEGEPRKEGSMYGQIKSGL